MDLSTIFFKEEFFWKAAGRGSCVCLFSFKKISSNSPAERAVAVVALRRVGTFLLVVKRFFLEAAVPSVSIHNFFLKKNFFGKPRVAGHVSVFFLLKK